MTVKVRASSAGGQYKEYKQYERNQSQDKQSREQCREYKRSIKEYSASIGRCTPAFTY